MQSENLVLRLRGDSGQYRVNISRSDTYHKLVEEVSRGFLYSARFVPAAWLKAYSL